MFFSRGRVSGGGRPCFGVLYAMVVYGNYGVNKDPSTTVRSKFFQNTNFLMSFFPVSPFALMYTIIFSLHYSFGRVIVVEPAWSK